MPTSAPLPPQDLDEVCVGLSPLAQDLAGKHVLVVGGRGFLGAHVIATLLRLNARQSGEPIRVTSVDSLVTATSSDLVSGHEHLRFVRHDSIIPWTMDGPVDLIVFAAGIASPAQYLKRPLETMQVATTGLQNALDIARRHGARLLSFSSSEVYGDPEPAAVPTPEDYPGRVPCLGPRACYSESKRLGETLVRVYAERFGVQSVIVRPFNVYGPGMQAHDGRVIPSIVARMIGGTPITLFGDGSQTRTFCYVSDAVNGALRVLLRGRAGHAYNIGNPTPEISMIDLVEVIRKTSDDPALKVSIRTAPGELSEDEPRRRCPDVGRARSELAYAPKVALEEGLRRFWRWARESYEPRRPS